MCIYAHIHTDRQNVLYFMDCLLLCGIYPLPFPQNLFLSISPPVAVPLGIMTPFPSATIDSHQLLWKGWGLMGTFCIHGEVGAPTLYRYCGRHGLMVATVMPYLDGSIS